MARKRMKEYSLLQYGKDKPTTPLPKSMYWRKSKNKRGNVEWRKARRHTKSREKYSETLAKKRGMDKDGLISNPLARTVLLEETAKRFEKKRKEKKQEIKEKRKKYYKSVRKRGRKVLKYMNKPTRRVKAKVKISM